MGLSEPTTVLIDNVCDPRFPGASGHSDIIWAIATRLARSGRRVVIVGPYDDVEMPAAHEGLEVVRFKRPRMFGENALGRIATVVAAVRAARSARIGRFTTFTTDAFSAGVCSLAMKRNSVLFLTSGNIHQRQASRYRLDAFAAAAYRLMSFFAARRCGRLIATSNDMASWWIRTGAEPRKVSVIPLGIDTTPFTRSRPELVSEPLRLLTIARLEGENNVSGTLSIAARLSKLNVPFTLEVVGDGSQMKSLQNFVETTGLSDVVRLVGAVPRSGLREAYAHSDVFVFTREAGAPPRAVMEAMAAGMAVVAYRSSGLEDYVQDDTNGLLEAVGDVESMVASIVSLHNDRQRLLKMKTAAQSWAAANFDWDTVFPRIAAEIDVRVAQTNSL